MKTDKEEKVTQISPLEESEGGINTQTVAYTDENIRHLSDMEHVRTRPGMYIGRLGDQAHRGRYRREPSCYST